jgi:hypothetical protein
MQTERHSHVTGKTECRSETESERDRDRDKEKQRNRERETRCAAQSLPFDPTTRTGVTSAAAAASLTFAGLILATYLWSRWHPAARTRRPAPAAGGDGGGGGGYEPAGFRGRTYDVDPADADACAKFLAQCAERARARTLSGFTTAGLSFKEQPSSWPAAPYAGGPGPGPAIFSSAPAAEHLLVGVS